ncbi:hypothetical protein [Yeosuana marina]|uniref:hypothetical protein n=1 Tax=Yeosuana marina TaxID=1565536 RepID=UPI00142396A9|nr:hypothetical protein [Yeosuana marina]|tara:strand:- start:745 stop:1050 length:306 start_codon:yes stop_codon:yes gene_type:complete
MKNTTLILLLFLFSIGAYAQKRSDFKGPAYKNYKPWLHKTEPITVYTVIKKTKLTGPAYKNQKPWQNTSEKKYVPIVFGSERSKLKGPEYKNYKPWRKNNN